MIADKLIMLNLSKSCKAEVGRAERGAHNLLRSEAGRRVMAVRDDRLVQYATDDKNIVYMISGIPTVSRCPYPYRAIQLSHSYDKVRSQDPVHQFRIYTGGTWCLKSNFCHPLDTERSWTRGEHSLVEKDLVFDTTRTTVS